MTSVGNFSGLENKDQYTGLLLYLQFGDKAFLTEHTSLENELKRLVSDASSYRLSEDETKILCGDKIVLHRDDWIEKIGALITNVKLEGETNLAEIEERLKELYYIGKNRNACSVQWLRGQIRVIRGIAITEIEDFKLCMPATSTDERSFHGTRKQVTNFLQYLAHLNKFEIRRTKVSALKNGEVLKHHYRCSVWKKPPKSSSVVSSEDDSDDELVLPCDEETDAKSVSLGTVSGSVDMKPSAMQAPAEGVRDLQELLQRESARFSMTAHGARGQDCEFRVWLLENCRDDVDMCFVIIHGIHNVHDPMSETHGYRSLHPTVEEGIRLAHSAGLSTAECIGQLQYFTKKFMSQQEIEFGKYEVAVISKDHDALDRCSIFGSPLKDMRSYGGRSIDPSSSILSGYKTALSDLASTLLGRSNHLGQIAADRFVENLDGYNEPEESVLLDAAMEEREQQQTYGISAPGVHEDGDAAGASSSVDVSSQVGDATGSRSNVVTLPTRPGVDCSIEEKAIYFKALCKALSAIGTLNCDLV